jgi:hypothetical protein
MSAHVVPAPVPVVQVSALAARPPGVLPVWRVTAMAFDTAPSTRTRRFLA